MNYNPGYKELASAIVVQAIDDSRKAAISYKKGINKDLAAKTMIEVINFFNSSWYKEICEVDPDIIINKLKEELEDDS